MLVHTVLMKLIPGTTESDLDDLSDRIRELAEAVSGPGNYAGGSNVTEEPLDQGYSYGFFIRFSNRDALSAYHVNPAHLAVNLAIRSISETVLVFDLET